jgi:hypothetical protein
MLHSVLVGPNILGTIDPLLFAVAFLDVVFEFSLVLASVDVSVLSITIGHIILELSSVHISFSVPEGSLSLSLVEVPLALVMGSIGPVLNSISMTKLINVFIILGVRPIMVIRHSSSVCRITLTHVGTFCV